MADSKVKYEKPPKSIAEQIELLKSRGLVIDDEERLAYYLTNISYYHWSIYFKHFQKNDEFIPGTNFEDVLNVYVFDNRLRLLILEVLERVEKSFKCRMAYELSVATNDSHCYLDSELYIDQASCDEVKTMIASEVSKSSEISIKHYLNKYNEPELPPIWSIVEILSFGQCLKICSRLKRENKNKIARSLGDDERFIMNWMHCLSHLRNKCAHHIRLWNCNLVITPVMYHRDYKEFFNGHNKKRIFNYLIVLQIILQKVNPTSRWLKRLEEAILEFEINTSHMGFPDDWKERLEAISDPIRNDKN
jgi:abortive infection bacteriophage resistance protein